MNLRKMLIITANDLRVYFSDAGNLVGLLVLPIMLTVILGVVFSGDDSSPNYIIVDVLDEDNTTSSQQLISSMQALNTRIAICPTDSNLVTCPDGLTREEGFERVEGQNTSGFIIIPAGFEAAIEQNTPITIEYVTQSGTAGAFGDPVQAALDPAVQQLNSALTATDVAFDVIDNLVVIGREVNVIQNEEQRTTTLDSLRQNATTILNSDPIQIRYELTEEGEQEGVSGITEGFGQSVPGQGATFVMFTVFGGIAILLAERRQWTLQRLVVMPLTRAEILGGKILTYFTLGIIQFAVIFLVGIFVGVDFGNSMLGVILLMISFVLATTALAIALATFLKTEGQVNGITQLLAFTLAPLGGAWWPIEIVPQWMQTLGHISPVAWMMDGFRDLIYRNGVLMDVLPEVSILLLYALVFFVIGIINFDYE